MGVMQCNAIVQENQKNLIRDFVSSIMFLNNSMLKLQFYYKIFLLLLKIFFRYVMALETLNKLIVIYYAKFIYFLYFSFYAQYYKAQQALNVEHSKTSRKTL